MEQQKGAVRAEPQSGWAVGQLNGVARAIPLSGSGAANKSGWAVGQLKRAARVVQGSGWAMGL